MKIKNDELFEGLRKHAEQLRETAPKSVPEGSLILDAAEADTLYNKINTKLTMGSADDKLIRHLRTSEGSTFDELLKSVQIKKWLTTRINKYVYQQIEKNKSSFEISEDTWEDYYEYLVNQADERETKLIPESCALGFLTGEGYEEGGICRYVKSN